MNRCYDAPRQQHHLQVAQLLEAGTTATAYCAWALWMLGYPDQALERGRQTLALLEQSEHPYTQSRSLYWNTILHEFRQEWAIVDERATRAMKSADEHGFSLVLAAGQIMQGAAMAATGQGKAGLQQMRDGLHAYQDKGGLFQRTHHLAMFAKALNAEGFPEEGLEALQDAANLVEATGEHYYEAEIHRLKGELLLTASPQAVTQAEACFHQALDVARYQEAKSLELRAATSLTRLWRQQDKNHEARELLALVYNWFTEGFDTADLKDAKVLLSELT